MTPHPSYTDPLRRAAWHQSMARRSRLLAMAVALCLGGVGAAHLTLTAALKLQADLITAEALRGW